MRALIILWLLLAGAAAAADPVAIALPPETAALKPGPGLEVAQANCAACHSADYVAYQPPGMGAGFWTAEVQKMIQVYKAPIAEADAKAIAAYLAASY